ncbi:hypothetical protein BDW59DRAFT_152788 [Aspergillus cavernicola]|uniref:Uncharacterized protein n=1 Tax=Aspergillus cavernicola TaxID=176166 RepID=A0ABR4HR36_9EURO
MVLRGKKEARTFDVNGPICMICMALYMNTYAHRPPRPQPTSDSPLHFHTAAPSRTWTHTLETVTSNTLSEAPNKAPPNGDTFSIQTLRA